MDKFFILIILLLIILNNNNFVKTKLSREQCHKWRELNHLIGENHEFQNKEDHLMLNSMFKKYCSPHPLDSNLEPIEGTDCQILRKIFTDVLKRDKLLNREHHHKNKNLKFRNDIINYLDSICSDKTIQIELESEKQF
ncbi:hypothetical protein ACTFIW_003477 [Dictyostelium discoideum]